MPTNRKPTCRAPECVPRPPRAWIRQTRRTGADRGDLASEAAGLFDTARRRRRFRPLLPFRNCFSLSTSAWARRRFLAEAMDIS
eukprot:475041-Prymnesium_polylepis.1